ncbi:MULTISPECIES: phage neck terminator protein [Salibacterium]|uniref:Phage neck terminator protein gp12-like domain-containing protein n=2 Tax=Salibacterium TaxID=1884429 RepID=A0A1I4Q6T6_9BACI|nr:MULTISPECIES: hypothetical protein [Salibacterium]SFM35779.1 hypothetical protein SAMN04488054_13733 [Salibacterium qingdaonense]SFP18682.1 hypothetical protein SAMN05518683_10357 [Salibacterium halotolerans]
MQNDITPVRNTIVKVLHDFTGRPVIPLEEAVGYEEDSKPSYPFINYKITTPFTREGGYPNEEFIDGTDTLTKVQTTQPTLTVSFTVYSTDSMEAYSEALKASECFEWDHLDLRQQNIAVAEIFNVENRDTLIEGDYERRYGFDVQFRVTRQIERNIDYATDVTTQKEE